MPGRVNYRPYRVARVAAALFLVFAAVAAHIGARAQSATAGGGGGRQTLMTPMSDGVKLATDVYLPAGTGPFPVIVARSTYDKNSLGPMVASAAVKRGYAYVVQDTRGRGESGGENLPFIGDFWGLHRDGYDTLEWVAAQPWCNGKIGTWGASALGITELGAAGSGSKRITCQHITVGAPSIYQYVIFPGGVFKKNQIEGWLKATKHAPNSVAFVASHAVYNKFWRQYDFATCWSHASAPAVHIGGWYDIFSQGTIDAFVGYQTRGGPGARGKQHLVMGPWTHGVGNPKAGQLTFPNASKPPNGLLDPLAWFDECLKGVKNGLGGLPAVSYYVMGDVTDPSAPGNVWRAANGWPPVKTRATRWFLRPDRSLSSARPKLAKTIDYSYDPAHPAPTVGGPQLLLPAGALDQREVESRPDVVAFTSDPLDRPIEVTGHVFADLWVSSDVPDTDFFVKLCDVYPDGRSINVCEGQIRARFREGLDRERLMEYGGVYQVPVDLWSTSIIFNKGHRLRLDVTSSSFPGYDPNPNTGDPFRSRARSDVARNTLRLGGEFASCIILPIAGDDGKKQQ